MSQHSHLYGREWRFARRRHLAREPLCRRHLKTTGEKVLATVVDHVVPHHGDVVLFWDENNWQSLCEDCHNGWKQRVEKARPAPGGFDVTGSPLQ